MRMTKISFFIDRVLHQEPALSHLATVMQTSLNSSQTVRLRSNLDEDEALPGLDYSLETQLALIRKSEDETHPDPAQLSELECFCDKVHLSIARPFLWMWGNVIRSVYGRIRK